MKHVFISPHIDDAFLSAGGLIINLLERGMEIRIDYIFTITEWTNFESISRKSYSTNKEEITAIRKEEEISINEIISYEYDFLDFLDFPLRKQIETNDITLVKLIFERLKEKITNTDCIYFPLGLDHPDHRLIHHIGQIFLQEGYKVIFYEDMPYMTYCIKDLKSYYDTLIQKKLVCETFQVNFEKKRKILECYSSQVSLSWIKSIRNYSYNLNENNYSERFWHNEKDFLF